MAAKMPASQKKHEQKESAAYERAEEAGAKKAGFNPKDKMAPPKKKAAPGKPKGKK